MCGDGMLPWITFVVSIGGFLFGYDTGVTSGGITMVANSFQIGSAYEKELFVSSTVIAAALGCFVTAYAKGATFGRISALLAAGIAYLVGAVIVAIAPTFSVAVIGRFVLGLGVGVESVMGPMMLAETAGPTKRASVITCHSFSIVLGQIVACCINIGAQHLSDDINWRLSMGIAALPALFFVISLFSIPESPRYLICNGRTDEARQVFLRVQGKTEGVCEEEFAALLKATREQSIRQDKETLASLWARPGIRRAFLVAIFLHIGAQASGINSVMYYGATILEQAGFGGSRSIDLTALLATAQGAGLVISVVLYSRLERRPVLCASIFCVSLGLMVLAASFNISRWLAVGGVLFYLFTFGVGFSSGPYIVANEIFPTYARQVGSAQGAIAMWLTNFLVSATFLTLSDAIGVGRTFMIYAACALLSLVFVAVELPETQGRTLEEISLKFSMNDSSSESSPLLDVP